MTVSHERKEPRTSGRRRACSGTVMGQGGWHRVNEGKSKHEPRSKPGVITQCCEDIVYTDRVESRSRVP